MNIHLGVRPSRPEDEPFIKTLMAEYDTERLCLGSWAENDQKVILDHQYKARTQHYANLDVDQKECVIEINGESGGRFIVIQSSEEIRLAEIALLAKFRGLGIGAAIIESIKQESAQSDRPLRLRVDKLNLPARDLYAKLGFYKIAETELDEHLEWSRNGPGGSKIHVPPSAPQ